MLLLKLVDSLHRTGLAPPGCDLPLDEFAGGSADNLLVPLADAWQEYCEAAARPGERRRASRRLDWLRREISRGASLTVGLPGSAYDRGVRLMGQRLCWWPQGVPAGHRSGLVSSRLGRRLEAEAEWFAALRSACGQVDPESELVLAAVGTTAARFVERAAGLFRLKVLRIETPHSEGMSLQAWFRRIERQSAHVPCESTLRVVISPPLEVDADPQPAGHVAEQAPLRDRVTETAPLRDRAIIALSDRVFVLRARRNGNVHHLVEARLAETAGPVTSVRIALGDRLVQTEMADVLIEQGALGWTVTDEEARIPDTGEPSTGRDMAGWEMVIEREAAARRKAAAAQVRDTPIVDVPPAAGWAYLTHCTRRQNGPWPDEREEQFLDDLILARPGADHSALAALVRIALKQRLIATGLAIRGKFRVVSLTEVPLAELRPLRVYRSHRGRWDFEPYGICIRRSWLGGQGAAPVQYGDEALWAAMPIEQRPYFQLQPPAPREGGVATDWRSEKEWRHLGDLDLGDLPDDAAMLFVPTRAEAERLAEISRWPVAVVGRGE